MIRPPTPNEIRMKQEAHAFYRGPGWFTCACIRCGLTPPPLVAVRMPACRGVAA